MEGNKWFSLIDRVWSGRTLELAWEKVESNAGACGVDGITVDRSAKDSRNRLLVVNGQLKRGIYQPKPVKRVWIDKPGGAAKRPLGIPTVTDRVVRAAARMVIEPIFEHRFAKHSYGLPSPCSGHASQGFAIRQGRYRVRRVPPRAWLQGCVAACGGTAASGEHARR